MKRLILALFLVFTVSSPAMADRIPKCGQVNVGSLTKTYKNATAVKKYFNVQRDIKTACRLMLDLEEIEGHGHGELFSDDAYMNTRNKAIQNVKTSIQFMDRHLLVVRDWLDSKGRKGAETKDVQRAMASLKQQQGTLRRAQKGLKVGIELAEEAHKKNPSCGH